MQRLVLSALALSVIALLPPAVSAAYRTGAPPDDAPRIEAPLVVAPWAKRAVHDGVAYFLYPASSTLRRFDLAAMNWLADVSVPAGAITFDVDADGIFVSLADRVVRLDLQGNSLQTVPNVPGGRTTLELGPGFVLVAQGQQFRTYAKADGAPLGATDIWYYVQRPSVMTASGRIYLWYNGLSPSDIIVVAADPATGALSNSLDSPYHGAWPAATYTFAGDAGDFVVDNTGTVYSDQLIYRGSLGGNSEAVAFLQDRFVVLRGSDLIVFSNALRELGRLRAPTGIADVFESDGTVYVATNQGSPAVTALDLAAARKPAPGPARAWTMSGMHADDMFEIAGGVLFASKTESAAYRFDAQTWTFSAPLALLPAPDRFAYSPAIDTLFASYEGGAIYAHPFAQSGTANYVASTAYTPHGLAAADEFVLAADYSGAWNSHYTFGVDGDLRSWVEWNYYSPAYTWDATTRRMYFFGEGDSRLHWEQIGSSGDIVAEGESPFQSAVGSYPPIRIAPNRATIVVGSGHVLAAGNLTSVGNLQRQVADVAWSGGDLYAVSDELPPRLLRFDATLNVLSSGTVRGTPRRLLTMGNGNFLYVADVAGRTVVGVFDPFLSQADLAVDTPVSGSLVAGGSNLNLSVTVGNNGSVAAQGARVTADLSAFQNVTWQCVPDAFATGCDNQVHAGPLDQVIGLGDGGQVRYLISATVPAAAMGTAGFPVQISAPTNTTDPELRNNGAFVEFRIDRLFKDGFGQ